MRRKILVDLIAVFVATSGAAYLDAEPGVASGEGHSNTIDLDPKDESVFGSVSLAPNGGTVAFTVKHWTRDGPREDLYLATHGDTGFTSRLALTSSGLSNLRWKTGQELTFIEREKPHDIQAMAPASLQIEQVYHASEAIQAFEWRESDGSLAVATIGTPDVATSTTTSLRLDDANLLDIVAGGGLPDSVRERNTSVWVVRPNGAVPQMTDVTRNLVQGLAWSAAGLVVQTAPKTAGWESEIRLFEPDGSPHGRLLFPELLPSPGLLSVLRTGSLAFNSYGADDTKKTTYYWGSPSLALGPLNGRSAIASPLPGARPTVSGIWSGNHGNIWIEARTDELGSDLRKFDRQGALKKIISSKGGQLTNCSLRPEADRGICVEESPEQPAHITLVDLRSGRLTRLQSPFRSEAVLPSNTFEQIEITNKFNRKSFGLLALPTGVKAGQTVPLAIIMYGFRLQYSRNGQWIGVYPVEEMRKSGIAVLLLNLPRPMPFVKHDFASARREMLEGPLSTIDSAMAVLAGKRMVRGRTMLMGWSYGGFLAAHYATLSTTTVAASIGEPAQWGISGYILGDAGYRRYLEGWFGGPPNRTFVDRYLDFIPSGGGLRPTARLMLEMNSGGSLPVLEYKTYWLNAGADLRTFVYPDAGHVFSRPDQILISRQRNLAWAKLNLLGNESASEVELRRVGLMSAGDVPSGDDR
ncbi:MAG: prolyl oligopeptidase family protein [Bradyrhizobium sp.]|nr:prolyl oligopeptidase family protein [Bradyrhizobium sp.]